MQRHAQHCHYAVKACKLHCFQEWQCSLVCNKKAAVMRQNLRINLRSLTVESVRNSSLRLSSLGQPTHGGTAASDIFPCFSLMKASCSLLNSPSRLCEQNSIITCHSWKKRHSSATSNVQVAKMCILTSLFFWPSACTRDFRNMRFPRL